MAYATSSIADLASLLTFIRDTCTLNGWTLSGNVLHKGDTYVEVMLDGSVGVRILGGNGKDGSNLLTTPGPQYAYFGTIAGIPLTYPMTCDIHINTAPDEVFVVINYSTSYYSLMAWGKSDVPGLTGTGNWYHANRTPQQGSREYQCSPAGIDTQTNFGVNVDGCPLFHVYTGAPGGNSSGTNNSFIHGDVDSGGWHGNTGSSNMASSNRFLSPLIAYSPNLWSGEALLIPFPVYMPRSSGSKQTLVADLKHIRHIRIDNIVPGDIITLGPDDWKVYPWFRKDITERDGGAENTHSGTLAYALRYTGP